MATRDNQRHLEQTVDVLIETITGTLAGYGVLGVFALYLIWQNWHKDKTIQSRDDRINDLTDRSADREIETTRILTELTVLVRALGGRM